MGTGQGKITFSKDISEYVVDIFERLYKDLGSPKYRILEAAIESFSELPREFQYALKGYNEADRKLCLDLIRELELRQQRSEPGIKARSSKTG